MKTRKIIVGKVCELNSETISSSNSFQSIRYLDTGSITRNKIENIQFLDSRILPFPSRAQRKVKKGTIIYSTVRPNQEHFGFLDNPEDNLIVSTGFLTLDVTDKDIDPKFLYYNLTRKELTNYIHTIAVNNVSSYPSINPDDLGNLELEIPSDKIVQEKISKILTIIDSKIELNNRINTELESMAKTLYDYWFVQFDFPDEKGRPYKTSGGKMLWNDELNREIPEGWEVGNLLDIADYINGLPCQKYRPVNEESLRVIKIKEMHEGFSSETEFVRLDIPDKAIIENGDVLFSWSASLEVQIWSRGKGALNQHIFKVTSEKYPKSFYYYQLVNYLQHFKMMAENRKTTMGHITQEHLQQSRITLPPLELTNKLEKIIAPFFSMRLNNDIENQKLSDLRDWLLPMLMNGQVRVR